MVRSRDVWLYEIRKLGTTACVCNRFDFTIFLAQSKTWELRNDNIPDIFTLYASHEHIIKKFICKTFAAFSFERSEVLHQVPLADFIYRNESGRQ